MALPGSGSREGAGAGGGRVRTRAGVGRGNAGGEAGGVRGKAGGVQASGGLCEVRTGEERRRRRALLKRRDEGPQAGSLQGFWRLPGSAVLEGNSAGGTVGCAESGGRGSPARAACCERPGKVQGTWPAGAGRAGSGGRRAAGRDRAPSTRRAPAAGHCSPSALCQGRRALPHRGKQSGRWSSGSPTGKGCVPSATG
ncbi:loricrin-like [Empidonax traillii]|uniref:loricrin-like n=1 Tax=Empidonax traillii TaxID=164674 RepID=UPI000FFCE385|nr:loricrin-like [Empidonax traillii]